jgi:hypothetical protein
MAILVAMSRLAVRMSLSWSADTGDLPLGYEASAAVIMAWSS